MNAVFFEPRGTPVFVTPSGSTKKLSNQTHKRVAYKLVFPTNSCFHARPEQVHGFIPAWGRTDVTLYREPGKTTTEEMTIQFACAPDGTDPKESFSTGEPQGEYGGDSHVKLVGTD